MKTNIYSKIIVGILIILTICFIGTCLYLNYYDHIINDSLIYGAFAFFTGEALAMAGIKISKVKNENNFNESFNNAESEPEDN